MAVRHEGIKDTPAIYAACNLRIQFAASTLGKLCVLSRKIIGSAIDKPVGFAPRCTF